MADLLLPPSGARTPSHGKFTGLRTVLPEACQGDFKQETLQGRQGGFPERWDDDGQ